MLTKEQKDFTKVVYPCKCETWRKRPSDAFAKITYKDGRLSICGVIGPFASGNCAGSAGQCTDEIRKGEPVEGWTREMLDMFCDIWDKWHLNDMRPYCSHQKELGWDVEAREKVTLYHYTLKADARDKKRAAEKDAVEHLKNGETFTPTAEQTMYASLPGWLDVYREATENELKFYEPKKKLYNGDGGATEEKTRGWVRFDEDPIGILCKPCPVCGYKYGSAWIKEDVPQEVLDFLRNLPDAAKRPAWV